MSLGRSSSFHILQESPLDHRAVTPAPARPEPPPSPLPQRWIASRYNVQTTTEDGRLIVWNTFRGSISTFRPELRDTIRALLTRRGCEGKPEGYIGYLRDRGYLLAAGTNEYRLFQSAFGHQHYRQDMLELTLLSSEDCNFRCQYCYEDFARGTMDPAVRENVKKLLAKRLPGLRFLTVGWFGGEPLYGWPAIADLAPYFREIASRHSLAFYSHMTTNGYLLTPDIADQLLSWGVLRYQITVDGAPEDHDRSRPARTGEGTFETIFRNLQALKRRSEEYIVEIRINFSPENSGRLEEFLALLGEEFGGDPRFRLRFRPVGRWGGSNDANLTVCGLDEADELSQRLGEAAHRQGLENCDDIRHTNEMGSQVCYAARPYHFIIGADGLVMKCTVELDKEDRNVVGRLTEKGDLELDANKFALWTEPAFATDSGCQKCVVLPVCQGISCPLIRIEKNDSPCIPLRSGAKRALRTADRHRFKAPRQVVLSPEQAALSERADSIQGG